VFTALLVGLVYLLVASGGSLHFDQSANPHHVLIADGWLHGHLHVREEALRAQSDDFYESLHTTIERQLASQGTRLTESEWQLLQRTWPPAPVTQDWAALNGKLYGYWGPMPALLLLPYVAVAGVHASDILVSCLVGMATVFVTFLGLRQAHHRGVLPTTTALCVALSLLLGLGTVHFYLTVLGRVWFFSQIVTTFFISLAIYCILQTRDGVGWPLASGAAFGAAMLSRTSILATIVFFYLALVALARQPSAAARRQLIRQAVAFSVPVIVAGAIAAAFNYARFGSLLETGLRLQTLTGDVDPIFKHRYALYGFFSWHYLPQNLYYYFVNPHLLRADGTNAITFDPQGNSMFLVTPALIYVFRTYRHGDWFVRGLWIGAAGSLATLLFFFGTGFYQFGNRYLLDLMPFAILLIAIGMKGRLTGVVTTLVALSIVVNAWGTYRFCLEGRPNGAVATYVTLGDLLREQGRHDEAIARYEAALRLEPTHPQAHNSLGVIFAEQGKLAEASTQFEQAVRAKPDYAEAHSNLGNVLQARGALAGAIAEHEASLRLRPSSGETENNLGTALAAQGNTAEAIVHFERAVQLNPDLVEARNNLADARRQLDAAGRHGRGEGRP
jgi:tetratricopeptide (TPR) repeat protein